MTGHAIARICQRLTADEAVALTGALDAYAAAHPSGSIAVRAMTLCRMRQEAWSDVSNGDVVVAIVRGGAVETVMLRRSSQPFNRGVFNVQTLDIL